MEYAQVILNNLLPESIKKPDFWISNAKMILAGVIWYLRKEHPKYCTLPHAISMILHNQIDVLIAKLPMTIRLAEWSPIYGKVSNELQKEPMRECYRLYRMLYRVEILTIYFGFSPVKMSIYI